MHQSFAMIVVGGAGLAMLCVAWKSLRNGDGGRMGVWAKRCGFVSGLLGAMALVVCLGMLRGGGVEEGVGGGGGGGGGAGGGGGELWLGLLLMCVTLLLLWVMFIVLGEGGEVGGEVGGEDLALGLDVGADHQVAFDLRRGFEDVQRISRLGYWDWDISKNTLHWSDEIYRLFGLKPRVFGATYDAFLERIHPEDREAVVDAVNDAVYSKAPYSIDHRVVRPDGKVRWVHEQGEVTFSESGEAIRMLGTVHDVTERIHGEAKFRALIELAPDAIVVADERGRIVLANREADKMFGYRRSEMIGEEIELLLPRDQVESHRGHRASFVEMPYARPMENIANLRGRRKNEETFPVEISLGPIKTEEGMLFAANVRDVTERRDSERRQRRMMNELDHRVKNNLAAVLSLASQSADLSENLDDFKDSFVGRVRVMARAHEMLAENRWDGVKVSSLTHLVLGRGLEGGRVRLEGKGEEIVLPAEAVMPVAMVLHELLTNAESYGSLSVAKGVVEVSWGRDEDGTFVLEWLERGGPGVVAPEREGMGLKLIRGMFEYQLAGKMELDFAESGLRGKFRVNLGGKAADEADKADGRVD